MRKTLFKEIIAFIRKCHKKPMGPVPLHAPVFTQAEIENVTGTISSTMVSSVGPFVDEVETEIERYTGSPQAIAVVNGTSALHLALVGSGVKHNDFIITQPLSFVATSNAISYTGAQPFYLDIDEGALGLSPELLVNFLEHQCEIRNDGFCYHIGTERRIPACVPVHVLGHPSRVDEISVICKRFNITVIEDAAESFGTFYKGKHTGTFGDIGIFSFNGNKIITSGGGGCIVTNDIELGKKLKHLSKQAKVEHPWQYEHNQIGYNYRLPNINAALLIDQLKRIEKIVENKRKLAGDYNNFFCGLGVSFLEEPPSSRSNYWLNAVKFQSPDERDEFLSLSNREEVMCRPLWTPMPLLEMYKGTDVNQIPNTLQWFNHTVNIPSSFSN